MAKSSGENTKAAWWGALWLVAATVAVASGCATQGESSAAGIDGPRTSDGALLTLESDRDGPVWRDWKPSPRRDSMPGVFAETVRAFDYWQIRDEAVIEEVWSAVFPVLDTVRAGAGSSAQQESMQLFLEAIEPSGRGEPTRMDLTFLVSSEGSERFEGFACRLYRRLDEEGVTPVVTVLLVREPEGGSTPSRIVVWAAPGFEEPDAVTALFERRDSRWRQGIASGLSLPLGDDLGDEPGDNYPSTEEEAAGEVVAQVLTESIWKRFAGDAYLESPQSGSMANEAGPEDVPRALGLEVEDRMIDQVYSDTKFPPRADLEDIR